MDPEMMVKVQVLGNSSERIRVTWKTSLIERNQAEAQWLEIDQEDH